MKTQINLLYLKLESIYNKNTLWKRFTFMEFITQKIQKT